MSSTHTFTQSHFLSTHQHVRITMIRTTEGRVGTGRPITCPHPPPCRLIYDKRSQAIFLRITSVGNIISVWPLGTRACFAPNTASAHLVCLAGSGETHSICAPKTLLSQLHYVSFNFHFPFILFFFFPLDLRLPMRFLAC